LGPWTFVHHSWLHGHLLSTTLSSSASLRRVFTMVLLVTPSWSRHLGHVHWYVPSIICSFHHLFLPSLLLPSLLPSFPFLPMSRLVVSASHCAPSQPLPVFVSPCGLTLWYCFCPMVSWYHAIMSAS
jgi:hypothetical protein